MHSCTFTLQPILPICTHTCLDSTYPKFCPGVAGSSPGFADSARAHFVREFAQRGTSPVAQYCSRATHANSCVPSPRCPHPDCTSCLADRSHFTTRRCGLAH